MDYDEFITGMRNENFFTMSKSFLPRLVAAPAAAIPLALLGPMGHQPPIDGSIMTQTSLVTNYCRFVTIYAPATLSLISLLLKTRYPLRTKEQLQMVKTICWYINLLNIFCTLSLPVSKHLRTKQNRNTRIIIIIIIIIEIYIN
jgi:hypothetical protein